MNKNTHAEAFGAEINQVLESVKIACWRWHPKTGAFDYTAPYEWLMGHAGNELARRYAMREERIHPDDSETVARHVEQLLSGQAKVIEHEFRLRHQNGAYVWVQERLTLANPLAEEKGPSVSGVIYSVDKIKQAELQAEAENKHRKQVAHLAGLGAWEWDVVHDQVSFNDDYIGLLGRDPKEMNGSFAHLKTLMPEEDLDRLAKGYKEYFARKDDSVFSMDVRAYNASGRIVWLLNIASVVERDDQGNPVLVRGGVLNIDKTVRMQKRLSSAYKVIKKRNQQLQSDIISAQRTITAMFDANPQVNILLDDQFHAMDCNPAAVEFFDFADQEDLLARFQLYREKDLPDTDQENIFQQLFGKHLERALADGFSEFMIEMPGKPAMRSIMKRIPYDDSFALIIYLIERSEEEERIQVMLDATPWGCVMFDENHNLIDCNLAALHLSGALNKEEYTEQYRKFFPEFQPDGQYSVKKERAVLEEAARVGRIVFNWTFILFPSDESALTEMTLVRVPWHNSYRLVGFIRDLRDVIAEQNKAREAESHTQMMLDSTPMVCTVWDIDGKVIDCNMEALRQFGLRKKSDYINKFYLLNPVFQPDAVPSRQKADELISKALESGYQRFEWEFRTAGGQALPSEVMLIRVTWNKGYRILAYSRDLREIKKANAEIERHTNLLQLVNKMAGELIVSAPDTFHEITLGQIKELCRSISANRVYLWENYRSGKNMLCRQTYAWEDDVDLENRSCPHEVLRYDDMPDIKRKIFAEEIINSRSEDLPDRLSGFLDKTRVKAVLIIPIKVESGIWGFIRFDNCTSEMIWPAIDTQALQSCGILIASSILRNRMTANLIATKNELSMRSAILTAANDAIFLLLTNQWAHLPRTLHNCLEILAKSIGADRVSFWRNFEDENGALRSRRLSGWTQGMGFKEREQETLIDFATYLPEWDKGAAERKELNLPVRYLHENLRNYEVISQSSSLLLVHIDMAGEFWGFIAFAHDQKEHLFSPVEIGVLRSGGTMIALAITSRKANQKLLENFASTRIKMWAEEAACSRATYQIERQIRMFAGLTTMARENADADIAHDCLNLAQTSSRQLLHDLSNHPPECFSSSSLETLSLALQEFDLRLMIEAVLATLQACMEKKQQHFQLDIAPIFKRKIISDEKLMALLLTNLLDNAIKYTSEGGLIRLNVWGKALSSDSVSLTIEVIDNGIGMEPQVLTRILRLFHQKSSMDHQIGQNDLGLVTSKNIAAALRGNIALESKEGCGCRFVVKLPVQWGEQAVESEASPFALQPMLCILIAGVMPNEQAFLRNLCDMLSLKCSTASSVKQAAHLIAHAQEKGSAYDILVLDSSLLFPANANGMEESWAKTLRQEQTKILLLAGDDQKAIVEKAQHLGITHVLIKPLLPSAVYNKLLAMSKQSMGMAAAD